MDKTLNNTNIINKPFIIVNGKCNKWMDINLNCNSFNIDDNTVLIQIVCSIYMILLMFCDYPTLNDKYFISVNNH